jgi:hypothetical protein
MFGHPGLAEPELVDELTHRTFTGAQQVEEPPAMGVSEDREGSGHTVEHASLVI